MTLTKFYMVLVTTKKKYRWQIDDGKIRSYRNDSADYTSRCPIACVHKEKHPGTFSFSCQFYMLGEQIGLNEKDIQTIVSAADNDLEDNPVYFRARQQLLNAVGLKENS
jgi:hypothetical protein